MMKCTLRYLWLAPILAWSSTALMGCDQGMSGKYGNTVMEVEFKSNSKAYVTMPGGTMMEFKYEVDGDKIILHNQGGNLVLTRNKDGTLSGSPADQLVGPMKKLT